MLDDGVRSIEGGFRAVVSSNSSFRREAKVVTRGTPRSSTSRAMVEEKARRPTQTSSRKRPKDAAASAGVDEVIDMSCVVRCCLVAKEKGARGNGGTISSDGCLLERGHFCDGKQ